MELGGRQGGFGLGQGLRYNPLGCQKASAGLQLQLSASETPEALMLM